MRRRPWSKLAGPGDRDRERQRAVGRRALVLGGAQLGLIGVLGARLYYLQAVESERYATLADENRIDVRPVAPPRGEILDRYGIALAQNRQNHRVLLLPEEAGDVDTVLNRLAQVIALDSDERARVREGMARRADFVPLLVREDLSWDEVSRVEVNAPNLPGVAIDTGLLRHYPLRAAAAHPVGFVGAVNEDELADGDPMLAMPGVRVGKTGIERRYEASLRGEAGQRQVEVNAVGRVTRELAYDGGQAGDTVSLTLDSGLQAYLADRLGEHRSSAGVVMDARSGEVYALAGYPSFDPNRFATGVDSAYWRELTNDPTAPLTNKPVQGLYAPGSTFKMMVMLAGLEAGVVGPETTHTCWGHLDYGGERYHCWRQSGHGEINLTGALRESCDVYFYQVAREVGVDRIAAMARRFGLDAPTGIELTGEQGGVIPTRAWKREALNAPWHGGETLITGIGQGYCQATPLQLAVMTARLVNGGRAVTPRLTRHVGGVGAELGRPIAEASPMAVASDHLALVNRAMREVTEDPRGTAYNARIPEDGAAMGGKTGTSQVREITQAEREEGLPDEAEKPWRLRHHALFVGYAPLSAPRYVTAVVVEHGGSGSQVAAPTARDILLEAQRRAPAGNIADGRQEPPSGAPGGGGAELG